MCYDPGKGPFTGGFSLGRKRSGKVGEGVAMSFGQPGRNVVHSNVLTPAVFRWSLSGTIPGGTGLDPVQGPGPVAPGQNGQEGWLHKLPLRPRLGEGSHGFQVARVEAAARVVSLWGTASRSKCFCWLLALIVVSLPGASVQLPAAWVLPGARSSAWAEPADGRVELGCEAATQSRAVPAAGS